MGIKKAIFQFRHKSRTLNMRGGEEGSALSQTRVFVAILYSAPPIFPLCFHPCVVVQFCSGKLLLSVGLYKGKVIRNFHELRNIVF